MKWPWVARHQLELLNYRLEQLERTEKVRAAEAEALVAELNKALARQRMQEARFVKHGPANNGSTEILDQALRARKGYQ